MDFEHLINIALRGLASGAIYGLVGMGFNVTYATTNVFNFAHGEFLMIGAMVGVFFTVDQGWPLLLALVAVMALAAVVGMIEERFAVRPAAKHGHAAFGWFLSTLGVSIVLSSGFAIAMGSDIRQFPRIFSDDATALGDVLIVPQQMAIIVLALLVGIGLSLLYSKTLFGRALGAIAQDRDAAALRGLPVSRLAMASFGISAALAALTGFMVAPLTTAFAAMGALFLFKGFIAAAVGGIPDIRGAMLGGFLLGLIEAFGTDYIGAGYRDAVTFGVLLIVLMVKPEGLFGARTAVRAV
jgi:branched-chain amino acid transport system permease protein